MATISSAPSATATVTPTGHGWWLKDPVAPTRNVRVYVPDGLTFSSDEPQEVLRPLGRANAVVVADSVIHSPTFTLPLHLPTPALAAAVRILREGQRTLLLTSDYGHALFVRLGGLQHRQVLMGGRTLDQVELQAVVVDAP